MGPIAKAVTQSVNIGNGGDGYKVYLSGDSISDWNSLSAAHYAAARTSAEIAVFRDRIAFGATSKCAFLGERRA